MADTLMPCATCKWAQWIPDNNEYGECVHPIAVEVRRPKPMSVVSAQGYSHVNLIYRHWTFSPTVPTCPTHEASND